MYRLVTNKIRCKFCGDIIISETRHDFKRCKCGKCATDGGLDYIRRAFEGDKPEAVFEDLSVYLNTETGTLVDARDMDKKDIPTGGDVKFEVQPVEVEEPVKPEVTEAVEAEPEKPVSEERVEHNEDRLKQKAEQVAKIKELKAEGKSFYDISKELGLPESTVRQYFKKN